MIKFTLMVIVAFTLITSCSTTPTSETAEKESTPEVNSQSSYAETSPRTPLIVRPEGWEKFEQGVILRVNTDSEEVSTTGK